MDDVKKIVGSVIGVLFAAIFVMNLFPTFVGSKADVNAVLANSTANNVSSADRMAVNIIALAVGIGVAYIFIREILHD
jgi:F0F1-type ATP synthase membrane subunit a